MGAAPRENARGFLLACLAGSVPVVPSWRGGQECSPSPGTARANSAAARPSRSPCSRLAAFGARGSADSEGSLCPGGCAGRRQAGSRQERGGPGCPGRPQTTRCSQQALGEERGVTGDNAPLWGLDPIPPTVSSTPTQAFTGGLVLGMETRKTLAYQQLVECEYVSVCCHGWWERPSGRGPRSVGAFQEVRLGVRGACPGRAS